ncbi:MAG: methyltransferase domain-containing protein [Pseudomonadales bacterium]|nr:methyltransferase domain-containing protein [Pseudomonadales bacterium]
MARCRICENDYAEFISFGNMPIANGFLSSEEFESEYFFELKVGFCADCQMVQLIDQPDREQMFHQDYAFFSSLSRGQQIHFQALAEKLLSNYLDGDSPFAVEIGSNDGIMLQHIAAAGISHLGVEPSENVARAAQEKGVNSVSRFFDEELAADVIQKYGHADTISSANVICHIPYMHSVLAGVKQLLKPTGVFIFEDPYLGDIVEKTSYDQIYDEHVFYFSVGSVSNMLTRHGLELFDVEPLSVHGGSMRYYIANRGTREVSTRVAEQLARETELGLHKIETYNRLRTNIEKSREDLTTLLQKIVKEQGRPVIAYGATSKSTTVLNYCDLGPELIEFISDTTPLKQGKYSPGMHIPVKSPDELEKSDPQYLLLFAWNHMQEIMDKEVDFKDKGGRWIAYVPEVGILT